MDEYKQVIVVRTDIKISKGKLAVQVAHAAVTAAFKAYMDERWRKWFDYWWKTGQKKIVVKGGGEKELLMIASEAEKLGLPVSVIRDAGLTELEPGTLTAIGIGPAPSELIDKITGRLKLL
jgi:PTH2 family peptidyl-tRNA hydrolase